MLCAWCPGAACHPQDLGPGQRHKSCGAFLFWERCCLCLQSVVFRWATECTLLSSTGTEGQRSGSLPPPILYLSGFPQDTLLPGVGVSSGCPPASLGHERSAPQFSQGHSFPEETAPQILVNKAEILLPKVKVSSNLAY